MSQPAPASGRVTRRMVALFVACALIPVGVTLAIAYVSVYEMLVAQRVGFLRGEAASYGTSLIERLNVADTLARTIGAELAATRALKQGGGLDTYFRGGAVLEPAGAVQLFGQPSAVPAEAQLKPLEARLPAGAPLLVVVRAPQARPGVWFVQHAGARRLALELHPDFLWSDDRLPYLTDMCVLDAERQPLNCSRPLSAAALEAVRTGPGASNGDFAWRDGAERHLSGYREIFLRARFGTDPWIVVASQPAAHALEPVYAIGWLVLPLILLGLLLAALVGLNQVRRALQPLAELTEATVRIAQRDFNVRLPAASDDEFGALAAAFNAMSQRLGRQFSAMQAHSEIDAVILSSVNLAEVAAIVLKRVAELAGAERYWLLLAEARSAERFTLFRPRGQVQHPGLRTLVLPEAERARLVAADIGATTPAGLPEPHPFTVPIVLGNELGGALVLAYDAPRRPDDEEVILLRDLTERVAVALATARRDEELYRSANFDSLTGLPNRLLAAQGLARSIAAAARDRKMLAVLFVDLDGFAAVNDSAGHAAGDQLLVETAVRLRGCVRKADVVARLGGDQFALVLSDVREPADAARAAKSAMEALSKPYMVRGAPAFVSASVGIAVYPGDGSDAEELLRHADLALYRAKQSGRRQFAFFEGSMNEEVRRRAELATELRQALEKGELELYYQPQLDLASGRIVGAEALMRWRHPTRGVVPPVQFIAFAESSGLIEEMGRWALAAAAAQFVAWRGEGLDIGHMSVNVSLRQLQRPGFAHVVAQALRQTGMAPSALRLELTESAILDQSSAANTNLAALTELGASLELDDFGTGYSSLAYLQRLPVAAVKLDRAFIRTIASSASSQAVVKAAIDMVHALGKKVAAEGVEEQRQKEVLARMGCDLMQGYLLSPPLPAERFLEFVRARATELT